MKKLKIDSNISCAKKEVLDNIDQYLGIGHTLYNAVGDIAKTTNVSQQTLWKWTLSQLMPNKQKKVHIKLRKPYVVKKAANIDDISANKKEPDNFVEEVKESHDFVDEEYNTHDFVDEDIGDELLDHEKVISDEEDDVVDIIDKELAASTSTITGKDDVMNYIGACTAINIESKIACLSKIKDVTYWREIYNKTKSKDLKVFINSNSTDYDIAEKGLKSKHADVRIAVMKMVYRHVQAGIKLWQDRDQNGKLITNAN